MSACTGPEQDLVDLDNDGYFEFEDCDDFNPNVHPGNVEVCDGFDNDCDSLVDNDAEGALEWFPDFDGDGYGVRGTDDFPTQVSCTIPLGYAPNKRDCNDDLAEVYPNAPELCNDRDDDCDTEIDEGLDTDTKWYEDRDGDGYGGGAPVHQGCTENEDWVRSDDDCNDLAFAVHPDADERCDGFDNDCDGLIDDVDPDVIGAKTWWIDADRDGYGYILGEVDSCTQPDGYVDNDQDCNDADRTVSPDTLWYRDVDHDDYGDPESPWGAPQCWAPIGYTNNALDCNDANPEQHSAALWYIDDDLDGFGEDPAVFVGCSDDPSWSRMNTDCNDNNIEIHPDAIEICDGTDNNCDTLIDDSDPLVIATDRWYEDADQDGYGVPNVFVVGCLPPDGYSQYNTDCNDDNGLQHPATVWWEDFDRDGFGNPNEIWPVPQCPIVPGYIYNNLDCDDTDYWQTPYTEWYTDADADGVGVWPISYVGCTNSEFYALEWGDCLDNDPTESSGICNVFPMGTATVSWETDLWPNETTIDIRCDGVSIFTDGPFNGQPSTWFDTTFETDTEVICQLYIYDSWGDGGPNWIVEACGTQILAGRVPTNGDGLQAEFTMPACSGCTDPLALNYDTQALVSQAICVY